MIRYINTILINCPPLVIFIWMISYTKLNFAIWRSKWLIAYSGIYPRNGDKGIMRTCSYAKKRFCTVLLYIYDVYFIASPTIPEALPFTIKACRAKRSFEH